MLLSSHRLGIAQDVAHRKLLRRIDADVLSLFVANGKRAIDDDLRSVLVLDLDTGFFDGLAKFYRRTVKDRNLPLNLNEQVGDPVAVQYGEKMLHGSDRKPFGSERGRISRGSNIVDMRGDRGIR